MENNPFKDNDELTSTDDNYSQTEQKDTRNEINDSIPTSSTDASITSSSSSTVQLIAPDDPISSTSSDIIDTNNTEPELECSSTKSSESIENLTINSLPQTSSFVSEKDLLDMNISDVSTEKITENVDDIVQDLENLLGKPTTSLDFSIKITETKPSTSKEVTYDYKVDNSDNVQQDQNICSASEEVVINEDLNSVNNRANEEITSNVEKLTTSSNDSQEVINDDSNISSTPNTENSSNVEVVDSSTNNNEEIQESVSVVNSQTSEKADDSMEIETNVSHENENIAGTSNHEDLQDSNDNQRGIVDENKGETSSEVVSETEKNEVKIDEIQSEEEKSEIVENSENKIEDLSREDKQDKFEHDSDNNEANNIPESTVEDVVNTMDQIQEVTDSNQVVDMEIEESNTIITKNDDNVVDSTNSADNQVLTTTIDETNADISKEIDEQSVNSSEITESSTNETNTENVEDNEKVDDKIEDSLPSTSSNIKLDQPLLINVDDCDKERQYSPKITIKPIKDEQNDEKDINKGSLKMTITKQSDTMHSILKIYNPDDNIETNNEVVENQELTVPKLIIKPVLQPSEHEHSPKLSTKSIRSNSPSSNNSGVTRSSSPRITIKPIIKPDNLTESVSPFKITIVKNDQQKHSPKLTIKPIVKPDEIIEETTKIHSPRITIKPIVKPDEDIVEQQKTHSPRVTIKPIIKPDEDIEQVENEPKIHSPKITIKPIVKPNDEETIQAPRITFKPLIKPQEVSEIVERTSIGSPKITIKPIVKPQDCEENQQYEASENQEEEQFKERIVLKINKGSLPSSSSTSSSSSSTISTSLSNNSKDDEKLTKITLKFPKEGGHPQIVQNISQKRPIDIQLINDPTLMNQEQEKLKKFKSNDYEHVNVTHSKLKEILNQTKMQNLNTKPVTIELDDDDDDDVKIVEENTTIQKPQSPIVISEESNPDVNQNSNDNNKIETVQIEENIQQQQPSLPPPLVEQSQQSEISTIIQPDVPTIITPRKRGRPRKVPLQVREDFKDIKEEEIKPIVIESTRPKRSCRGQSVKTTLGIKPRKPRGPGRGRGSKRGMGTRPLPAPPVAIKDTKSKLMRDDQISTEIDDGGFLKTTLNSGNLSQQATISTSDRADIVMYEEETRMSADTSNNRSKQVATPISIMDIEESQSSVQSTATIESVKVRRGPRLEVHQEPEGSVISADQLAEYYWGGSGPYMLQEQVAQFLGIKSFKRKYPNIPRRVVDMQERDFIRESGLACEAMCDLGLTAVNTADILDIMYSDFQDKYEEYCKHQRDRQAKDLTNKQRALSLAASQEKTKLDITQQAVQSAANWNLNFNKMRRTQRKACMDLQTLTVHYPRGKVKSLNRPKVGYYPVALVPGQFTDYYREFSSTELLRLPVNTIRHVNKFNEMECDSQTDGSGSESDSSSSDTDSSYSGSSDGENCTLCKPQNRRIAAV